MFDEAIAKGLSGLTLHRDRNGNWQASSKWGTSDGWRCFTASSADDAVGQALRSQKEIIDGSDLV
jgi:hypothetical protein